MLVFTLKKFKGSMGENLVGCCLMQGSAVHCRLAARLIEKFPGLVNDIFLSEDYYGGCFSGSFLTVLTLLKVSPHSTWPL
jgi:hypothetical protein